MIIKWFVMDTILVLQMESFSGLLSSGLRKKESLNPAEEEFNEK